jgi:hypothetical protein
MATAGGKTALGAAARSVREAIQPLGQKPPGPFPHDGVLDANSQGHVGVRVPRRQEKNDLPPAHPAGGEGGRPIAFTRVMGLFAPVFSRPVWPHVKVLLTGAVLAPGTRTVTAMLQIMGLSAASDCPTYHRVLNRAV